MADVRRFPCHPGTERRTSKGLCRLRTCTTQNSCQRFRPSKTALSVAEQGEETIHYRRESDPRVDAVNTSIVGVWSSQHYTGGRSYERFLEDGSWSFRLPLSPRSRRGTWTRAKCRIHLRWEGAGEKTYLLSERDGKSVLRADDGATLLFIGETLWHPQTTTVD